MLVNRLVVAGRRPDAVRRRVLLPALAILLACAANPVLAQSASSKSTDDTVGRGDKGFKDGRHELKRLAGCVYTRSPSYVDALLRTRPGSREEGRVMERVGSVMENCMRALASAMTIHTGQTRGSLAEARYLAAHPTPPAFGTGAKPVVPVDPAWVDPKLSEGEKIEVLKQEFADCVVAADPAASDAVLRTDPASAEEAAAARRVTPQLGPCLQDGVTFTLDRAVLRALLAQGLDRGARVWLASATGQGAGQR